jgi:transcriptional regulator GlxA family with amidase domain
MRFDIPVFDGFDEIDVFGPFEVLSAAGFEVALVAVEQPGMVTSMRGLRVAIDVVLGSPDALLIPGGGWLNHAQEGSWAQAQRGVLPQKIAALTPTTALVASVCTGSLLLASSGVLEGRNATTNRNALDELRGFGVNVVEERVVDDGQFVTAGGLTAGIDLGLWIVERELGTAAADEVAHSIEYERQGRVWRSGAHR